jgi:hypothetical protein
MLDEMSINTDTVVTEDTFAFYLLKFVIAIIVGLFMGFILTQMLEIGAAILGGLAGQFIAVVIYKLLFFWVESTAIVVILSIICIVGMAVLSFKYYDIIVVFSTSFIGSYGVCRGISLFAGYFPSEIELYNTITNGTHIDLSW